MLPSHGLNYQSFKIVGYLLVLKLKRPSSCILCIHTSLPLQADLVSTRICIPNTFCPLRCYTFCYLWEGTCIQVFKCTVSTMKKSNLIYITGGGKGKCISHPPSAYTHTHSDTVSSEKLERTYRDGTDPTRLRANHTAHRAHATVDMVV